MNSYKKENNNHKKNAVIYCRVSTKEQVEEGNSLATQEKLCREYALKNDYEVIETFIELGESAKTANRTELKKMFSFCGEKKNKVEIVIAYKLDRISRNTDDYSQIRILLKRYNVEIKSTTEFFEDSPAGRFMENIIANVAQFDNDVRAERSINGMRDATREGRYVWMAPIGYDNIKHIGKSTITPNKTMGVLISRMFSLVATSSRSLEGVRKLITEEGLLGKSGKPILKSHFYTVLRNELYTGWIVKFGERHRGHFEPLVSDAVFQKVQLVLKRRTRRNSHYLTANPDFPLRRFVQHPSGLLLTGSWSTGRNEKYPYYRFFRKGCNYNKTMLDTKFSEFMNRYKLDKGTLTKLKQFKERLGKAIKTDRQLLDHFKKRAEIIKDEIYNLNTKHSKGLISDQVLKMQSERLEAEFNDVQISIDNEPEIYAEESEIFEFVQEYIKNPGKIWLKVPYPQKIKLQWFQFPKGITFDGENFRTTDISFIFKVKSEFPPSFSSRVHYTNRNKNNPEIAISVKEKLDWKQYHSELANLNEILKDVDINDNNI